MEVEEIHNHTNTARSGSLLRMVTGMPASRILKRRGQHQNDDEDDDDDDDDDGGGGVEVRTNVGGRDFESNDFDNNDNNNSSSSDKKNQLVAWPNASRIVRVSRVSGCKDRHSKVLTSRGLRDRRIRLSVTTAIRFYELQDRLGYDQPSKAVEWLIKAAADPIADLPSLNNSFPETPNTQETDLDGSFQQQQQLATLSKSSAPAAALCTCSSTSDASISKGSSLSLSRTDVRLNRGKARERERASKDNHSECNNNKNSVAARPSSHNNDNRNNDSNASFTGLLASAASAVHHFDSFNSGLLFQPRPNNSSGFFGQMQLGNPFPFNVGGGGEQQSELQHFSVVPDHLIPASSAQSQAGSGSGDSRLNFTVSPGSCGGRGLSAGFNRGTLQSNSPPVWTPHMTQRLTTVDGPSNFPLFLGGATATPVEGHTHTRHHHPFSSGLDSRLLFSYGDGARHNSDQKGKGKH